MAKSYGNYGRVSIASRLVYLRALLAVPVLKLAGVFQAMTGALLWLTDWVAGPDPDEPDPVEHPEPAEAKWPDDTPGGWMGG